MIYYIEKKKKTNPKTVTNIDSPKINFNIRILIKLEKNNF